MKSFIALSLLAAVAALAAPEPAARGDAIKPVKQADTKRPDCREQTGSWLLGSPTFTEDCAGTIEYCLRGFYSRHGEVFADADACLRSRGLDPATAIDAMRIVHMEDYKKGLSILQEANHFHRRYMLLKMVEVTRVSDENDKETNDLLGKLWSSDMYRESQNTRRFRDIMAEAKSHLKFAFVGKYDKEIDARLKEAEDEMKAAWDKIQGQDVSQLIQLHQWFDENSEKKYWHNW